MINWILVQRVTLSVLIILMLIVGVTALIRVIPEINQIVNDAMEEDEKRAAIAVATQSDLKNIN